MLTTYEATITCTARRTGVKDGAPDETLTTFTVTTRLDGEGWSGADEEARARLRDFVAHGTKLVEQVLTGSPTTTQKVAA